MTGENVDPEALGGLNNLLGYMQSVQQRDDFRVFLENTDASFFKKLFSELFDEEKELTERFREFRLLINERYFQLYNIDKVEHYSPIF